MSNRSNATRGPGQLLRGGDGQRSKDGRRLAAVLERAERLARLQRVVADCLGAPLAQHCHVVGFHQGDLRLLVHSPAQATQLRYRQVELLASFNARLEHLRAPQRAAKLSIVVRPLTQPATRRRDHTPVGISSAAASHLQRLAADEEDADLRASLSRLIGRARP